MQAKLLSANEEEWEASRIFTRLKGYNGFLSGAQGMQIHELRSCYNYYSENWIQKEVKQCLLGQKTTIV